MKRFLLTAIAVGVVAVGGVCAQNPTPQPKVTAQDMVAITPMLSSRMGMPDDAVHSLGNKLGQMVTQNGFGSMSGQFVLTANVVTVDKQATATAPPQFVVDLEVSIYALNVVEKVIVDEMVFTLKGIDRLENKAVIQAINQINARTPKVRMFMEGVRRQIIEYYNTRIPSIVAKAQSLASRHEYEQALAVLGAVPEGVTQYEMVANVMSAIHRQKIDRDASAAIQRAKGLVAVRNYEGALEALLEIDPSSSQSKDALAIIEQIKSQVDAEEQRAIDEKWKLHEDARQDAREERESELERARINAESQRLLNEWYYERFHI